MASPATIGTTPILVVGKNFRRAKLYLQNEGVTTLYFKRQLTHLIDNPFSTNYDFAIEPMATGGANAIPREYVSIDPLMVVSSAAAGVLAFYETEYT